MVEEFPQVNTVTTLSSGQELVDELARLKEKYASYIGLPPEGYIKEVKDKILRVIPTSPEWAEMMGCGHIAAMVPDAYVENSMGKIKLNLIQCYIGESGSFKTVPLNEFCLNVFVELQKRLKKNILFAKNFTYEGAVKALNSLNNENEEDEKANKKKPKSEDYNLLFSGGTWVRDEFTQVFKQQKSKQYQSELYEVLSEFWDGTLQTRWLSGAGNQCVNNIYFNALIASSEAFFKDVDRDIYIQGWGNRILITWDEYESPHIDQIFRSKNPTVAESEILENDIYSDGKGYCIARLYALWKEKPTLIFVPPSVQVAWNKYAEFQRVRRNEIKRTDPTSIKGMYVKRMAVFAMKLAGIHCISRNIELLYDDWNYVEVQGEDCVDNTNADARNERGITLEMNQYDLDWAIGRVEKHYMYYEKIMPKLPSGEKKNQVNVDTGLRDLLLNYINGLEDNITTVDEAAENCDIVDTLTHTNTRRALNGLASKGKLYKADQNEVKLLPPEIIERHKLKDGQAWKCAYSTKPFTYIKTDQ